METSVQVYPDSDKANEAWKEAMYELAQEREVNIKGEELTCTKHGLDYRIACDECQDKHEMFSELLKKTMKHAC